MKHALVLTIVFFLFLLDALYGVSRLVAQPARETSDKRVALLVAHEKGWKDDPDLRYAIRGDLEPLAVVLSRNGFHVMPLRNPSPEQVRQVFQRFAVRQDISTFLFYYSGHADTNYFHLGPDQKNPLRYSEFVDFFLQLHVKRRLAWIDSCYSGEVIRKFGIRVFQQRQRHRYRPKGVQGKASFSILPTVQGFRNRLKGTQILASSQSYSFESQKLKASMFTYYLMQGLQGQADLNGDGKVSIKELYLYIQPRLQREAEQSVQQWMHMKELTYMEGEDYALVPNQTSKLVLHEKMMGTLHVRVENFFWFYHKEQPRIVKLQVLHGKGVVERRNQRQCWKQEVYLPRHGEVSLGDQWQSIPCRVSKIARKGSVLIQSDVSIVPVPSVWSVEWQVGNTFSAFLGSPWMMGVAIGLQHPFFGISFGAHGTSVPYRDERYTHLLMEILTEAGYRWRWSRWELAVRGLLAVGLLLQDVNQQAKTGMVFRYGLRITPGFQLTRHWVLRLHLEGGGIPAQIGTQWMQFGFLGTHLALAYHW